MRPPECAPPECIWAAGAILGEGPIYDPRGDALLFVDIKGRRLHRLSLADGARDQWDTPAPICWVAPRRDRPGYISAIGSAFGELELDPFSFRPFAEPEAQLPGNRFNDAKVDPHGRLWAGSMDDGETAFSGSLYRVDKDLSVQPMHGGYCVANGPAFAPSGDVIYHTDSARRTVWRFALSASGEIGEPEVFVTFEESWGYPDGITTDAEGGVWIAHWQGSCISRFSPDGRRERSIALPVSQVTSCAFGGPDMDRMFVTTAAIGVSDEPLAGALFEVYPGVRGCAPALFEG